MSQQEILYLSREDLESINLPLPEIIESVEAMFIEKGQGRVEMPPKPGIHPGNDSFIHAMPAYVPSVRAAGVKWVSGFPANLVRGLPYISGLLILNDPETGMPLAVMDCTWITAQRTGAATAVAARYLARSDSSRIGIIACGVQGRSNLEALCSVFDIRHVRAFDTNKDAALRYAADMGQKLKVDVEVVEQPADCVRGADIVVTSGPILKHPNPAIEPDWLGPGAFACPLDFDSYWQIRALEQIDLLATDDRAQFDYYRSTGYFSGTPAPAADLGEIISGQKPGRQNPEQRTMSINLGLAAEDMVTAIRIYQRAQKMGIGTLLPA